MAIKSWLAYLVQQLSAAAAVLCAVLVLSEILLPGSVLPYFNLHALVLATFAICLVSPSVLAPSWWMRLLTILPLGLLAALYAFFILWSGGFAANMVFIALLGVLVCVIAALVIPSVVEEPSPSLQVEDEAILVDGEMIKIEIEEETSVFMR